MQGAGPLTVLWVQPARRGLSGRAVRRSAGVSSRTRVPVIGGTAAAPARPASGASGARTVSAGVCGGRAPGPAEPCRPFSSRPLQSVSRAPLGWGAGRRAPALWAQPVTPSAVSVGSSVRLATAGRTVTKVSDGLCVQDLGRVQVVGFMMGTGHRKLQAGGQVSPAAWWGAPLPAVSLSWSSSDAAAVCACVPERAAQVGAGVCAQGPAQRRGRCLSEVIHSLAHLFIPWEHTELMLGCQSPFWMA